MNKILILCGALLLTACAADYQNPRSYSTTINGHDYLIFKVDGDFGQSYVHSPDCKMEN